MHGLWLDHMILFFILTFGSAIIVRADGGIVLWQQTTGSITVTAFTTPSPLRTGPADISFLIEDKDQSRPILDAKVFVSLDDDEGVTIHKEATHDQAHNKLLYCTVMNLARAGNWRMKVNVAHGAENFDLVDEVEITEAQSPLIAQWKLILFPFTIIILFIVHQRLAWKEKSLC